MELDYKYIIGLCVSGIIAFWKIWNTNRNRQKLQLSLVDRNWLPIVNISETHFENWKVKYELPFSGNQYYFRGTIMNTGNRDIHKNLIVKPIRISFKDDCKIISTNISQDEDYVADVETYLKDEGAVLSWDLLKPLEKFSFELIIESSKNYTLYELKEKIQWDCRIADLNTIERLNTWQLKSQKRSYWIREIPSFIFILVFLFLAGAGIIKSAENLSRKTTRIDYTVTLPDSTEPITLKYYTKDSVKISSDDKFVIVPIKKIRENIAIRTNVTESKVGILMLVIYSALFILMIWGIYNKIKEGLTEDELRKILKAL